MIDYSHIYYNDMTERYENEKLHVTLMNSTFMLRDKNKIDSVVTDSNLHARSFFNGMKIIKRMKNFSFGVHIIDEFILNEMRIDIKTDNYIVQNKFKI